MKEYSPAGSDFLEPDLSKTAQALINWGYTIEQSLSDLIDNSIDAKATKIHLIFKIPENGRIRLEIHDNGHGMDAKTLKEAMRQGSKTNKKDFELGKYGYGLKIASLNQSTSLLVITSSQNKKNAREITKTSIENKHQCFYFNDNTCNKMWEEIHYFKKSGTIIVWDELKNYPTQKFQENSKVYNRIIKAISKHIGIVFHRYLEKSVSITYELREEKDGFKSNTIFSIDPVDPFGYSTPGDKNFPRSVTITKGKSKAKVTFHIWPKELKNETDKRNYKLAGGANDAQGYYFYRNDRLIQFGGWGHDHSTEPHKSLARIEVEFKGSAEDFISVDVTKTKAIISDLFYTLVSDAKIPINEKKISFNDYKTLCEEIYRKKDILKNESKINFTLKGYSDSNSKYDVTVKTVPKQKSLIELNYNKGWVISYNHKIDSLFHTSKAKEILHKLLFQSTMVELDNKSDQKQIKSRIKALNKLLGD